MKNKLISLFVLTLGLVMSSNLFASFEYPFRAGNFEEAEKLAKKEGKPLLVDFYATWCGPCKWMEETTFQDPGVKELMHQEYISVRINIDEFDGYTLKSKYDVRYLPTLLIFNNGRVVERIEETLGVIRLTNLLQTHKSPSSAKKEVKEVNTNPKEKAKPVASLTTQNQLTSQQSLSEGEIASNFKPSSHVYTLQVGAFSKLDGARKVESELKKHFMDNCEIRNDYIGNQAVNKVFFGSYVTKEDAEEARKKIKNLAKMDAIVIEQ